MENIEGKLLEVIGQKLASLPDCVEQRDTLTVCMRSPEASVKNFELSSCVQTLSEEVQTQLRALEDLKECCAEQSCSRRREPVLAALWRRLPRLHRCTRKLAARSNARITEWSEISSSVRSSLLLYYHSAN